MFERNAGNPLETDVIIIDEMSMVDLYLMNALLQAMVPGTRLVIVGDANQLPSIGAGNVLKDMIASGQFKPDLPSGRRQPYRKKCPSDPSGKTS